MYPAGAVPAPRDFKGDIQMKMLFAFSTAALLAVSGPALAGDTASPAGAKV